MSSYPSRIGILAGVMAAGALSPAFADDIYYGLQTPHTSWSVFAGATETDNATLAPHGPSDTIATGGLGLSLYRDTGRLQADVDGSVRYEDYLDNTYSAHTLGSLVGKASYAMVPEYLNWVLQDTYGQLAANTFLPTTPANRINANYVSTGPDGDIPLAGNVDLTLGARYSESDFQKNPYIPEINNETVTGKLGLIDHLTSLSSLSLNASTSHVDYLATGIPGYDEVDLFGRYDLRTRRSGFSIDAGASEVKDAGQTTHNPLVRLTLFHRLTPSWNVNLTGGTQFQNSGQAFASELSGERVVNGQVVPTNPSAPGQATLPGNLALGQSPFRSDSANLTFDFVRPRTQFDIGAGYSRVKYSFSSGAYDFSVKQANADFMRRLRPTLSFRVSATYVNQSPEETLPGNRTTSGTAGFDWRPGALLGLTLSYSHTDRTSDAGGISYVQNMVYVGVTYGPPKPVVRFEPVGQPQYQNPGQTPGSFPTH